MEGDEGGDGGGCDVGEHEVSFFEGEEEEGEGECQFFLVKEGERIWRRRMNNLQCHHNGKNDMFLKRRPVERIQSIVLHGCRK